MGVPELETTMEQAKKRQRLSLKGTRLKKTPSPIQDSTSSNNNARKDISKKSDERESLRSESSTSTRTGTTASTSSSSTSATGSSKSASSTSTSTASSSTLTASNSTSNTSSYETCRDSSASTSSDTVYSSSASKVDVRVPAVASLENLGNTCFMNSVMQVLRYTPGFLHSLAVLFQDIQASEKIKRKNKPASEETASTDEDNTKTCWKIVKNVYKVYRDLSALEEKYEEVASDDIMSMAVKPNKVLQAVRELNPMYEGNLQHDAQEFLRCLLCYFQDAEKEVQKFYTQLPQKFSPKINPIMQRFLTCSRTNPETKERIVKLVNEISSSIEDTKLAADEVGDICEAEKVKVNLFPKSEIETEAVKSPSKVQHFPNLGDTAGVVDQANEKVVQVGAKTELDDNMDLDSGDFTGAREDLESKQKGRSARRGRRFKPYDTSQESSGRGNAVKGKGRGKNNGPGKDVTQPSVSDMFTGKTYGSKKRLGMRGAVRKTSAELLFDEIKELENAVGEKAGSKVSGDTKSCDNAENQMDFSVPKSTALSSSQSETSAGPSKSGVQSSVSKSKVQSPKKNLSCENILLASSSGSKTGTDSKKEECSVLESSYQNAFEAFLNPEHSEDSDSMEIQSDSDDENIVLRKKREKELRNSPRRSPRKMVSELCLPSPRKHEISKLVIGESKSESALLAHAKHKLEFDDVCKSKSGNSEKQQDRDLNQNSVLALSPKKSDHCINKTGIKEEPSAGSPVTEAGSDCKVPTPKTPVVLVPVVKLENCDYILSENGTSVSAAYAAKCLTPVKKERRSSSSSGNYLKERSQLYTMNTSDEEAFKKALAEMLNSPVKSRSKYDLIERTFQGSMMLRTRCLQCESSKERQEDFHDISVPVRIENTDSDDEDGDSEEKPQTLLDLIEASTAVEKLLEDNKYYCDECKAYVEAERSIHYDIMPDILSLHLKRFSAETGNPGNMTKVNDHIDIPLNLPCLRYRCSKSCLRPDHRYRLYGIVTHSGYTLTSGHYLSYVRTLPNEPLEPISFKFENSAHIKTEPKEEPQSSTNKVMPSTRKKMGVVTKLPSRFDSSIISDTKVKAFESVAAKKLKTDLAAKLMPTKRFDTEWFECDDETVRVFEESEFADLLTETSGSLLGTPYLLFYHKVTMC